MKSGRSLCVLSAFLIASQHALAQGATVSGRMIAQPGTLVRNHYVQAYTIDSRPDAPLRSVELSSKDFDPVLIAVAPDGKTYDDDDSGGNTSARLQFAPNPGQWLIVVTAFDPRSPGRFSLTVDGPRPVPTSRSLPPAALERLSAIGANAGSARVDTVTVTKVDTVRIMRADTVYRTRVDTVVRTTPAPSVPRSAPR